MGQRGLRVLAVLLTIALVLPAPAHAARTKDAPTTETAWGLRRAIFPTENGRVVVNLPDDLAGGDMVTGTVVAEPAGDSEREIRKNQEALDALVVEVEKSGTPVRAGVFRFIIPAAMAGAQAQVVLKDGEGREAGRLAILVGRPPSYPTHPPAPAPEDYLLPPVGLAGGAIEIEGPFDGDFGTTSIRIGGREARKLAESPRKMIAEGPRGVVGRTTLDLKEGGAAVRTDFRLVTQTLSLLKKELVRDEATVLTVRVEGLDGLEEPIEIRLVNRTPQVVRMEGGDSWTSLIRPLYVEPGGVATLARTLTGIVKAPFEIAAGIVAEPEGRDAWHVFKGLARTADDLGLFIDSAGRDLDAYAAEGGMPPERAASVKERLAACRPVAAADLGGAMRCADLALREIDAARVAASRWPSGLDLYRAATGLMAGWLADGKAEVPFHRMNEGLDLLVAAAETSGDADGAKLLRDVKTLTDYVRNGAATRERLREVLVKIQEYKPRPKPGTAQPPGTDPAPTATPGSGPAPTAAPGTGPAPSPAPGAGPQPSGGAP